MLSDLPMSDRGFHDLGAAPLMAGPTARAALAPVGPRRLATHRVCTGTPSAIAAVVCLKSAAGATPGDPEVAILFFHPPPRIGAGASGGA